MAYPMGQRRHRLEERQQQQQQQEEQRQLQKPVPKQQHRDLLPKRQRVRPDLRCC